jgi:hypothetical protein
MSGVTLIDDVHGRSATSIEGSHPVTLIDPSESNEVSFAAPAIITPTAGRRFRSGTLLHSDKCSPSSEDFIRLDLEQARRDAEQSAQALERLMDGIRAVKRVLVASSSGDEADEPKSSNDDIQQIHQISGSLHGVLGSDLLALVNTADMIREHSRLAFQETSDVVADLRKAKLEAQLAAVEAKQTRKVARALFKANTELKWRVEKLCQEKHMLVKEVKALRESQFLEGQVLKSLTAHELVLRTPSSATPKKYIFDDIDWDDKVNESTDDSGTVDEENVRRGPGFQRGFQIFRRNNRTTNLDTENPDLPGDSMNAKKDALYRVFGTPTRYRPKSPMPGLDEISTITEDSSAAKAPDAQEDEGACQALGERIPLNEKTRNNIAQHSPLVSPRGVPLPDCKGSCDPNVVSTLVMPDSFDEADVLELPYPRKQISETLYEC